jgi:dipeptidyl aminopeptidase/acylaminoacyl peptidase
MTRYLPQNKNTRLAIALATVLVAVGAIAFGVAISADPPQSGPAVDSHSEHSDIWKVNVQTREITRATLNADALEPTWASDGEIAFSTQSCDECNSEIHVDPTGPTNDAPVPTNVLHLFQPSWAPDGHRVAVIRLGHGIWVLDDRTRTATRLTTGRSDEAPAWSPNGDWVVYDRLVQNTNYDIYAVHSQTLDRRRLTRDSAAQTHPTWSPDGNRIAFAEQQSNGKWSIVTMGFDGNGRKRITGSQISAQEPAWSPDGKQIAFILQGLDSASVALINADGSGSITHLTDESLFPSRPTWSPGGTSVAFSATVVP